MIVALISPEKAQEITGKEYTKGVKYNPVEYRENFYISLVEAQYLTTGDIVGLVDYVPKEEEYENE